MTLKQYPHYLFIHVVEESTQDGDGSWTSPVDSWKLHSICREESNGKGAVVNGLDGKAIVFSSAIYMPKTAARITEGAEVLVSETDSVNEFTRVKGEVLKFSKGQLNARLWI